MITPPVLTLRPVTDNDCRMLWEWANDPLVRISAFSNAPIPWEDHVRWFKAQREDPRCLIFIAENDRKQPIGQIRFHLDDRETTVDLHIAKDHRGKRYSSPLIRAGMERLFRQTEATSVHAFVKLSNAASRKAFLGAGFHERGTECMRGCAVYHLVFPRS